MPQEVPRLAALTARTHLPLAVYVRGELSLSDVQGSPGLPLRRALSVYGVQEVNNLPLRASDWLRKAVAAHQRQSMNAGAPVRMCESETPHDQGVWMASFRAARC